MFHLGEQFAVRQLRIVVDAVLAALHRHRPHAGGLTGFHDRVFVERFGPALDAFVERLLMFEPPGQGREARFRRPVRRAHRRYQGPPFRVVMADDRAPVVIAAARRAVGVVRRHRRAAIVVQNRCAGPVRPVARRKARPSRSPAVDRGIEQGRPQQRHSVQHL